MELHFLPTRFFVPIFLGSHYHMIICRKPKVCPQNHHFPSLFFPPNSQLSSHFLKDIWGSVWPAPIGSIYYDTPILFWSRPSERVPHPRSLRPQIIISAYLPPPDWNLIWAWTPFCPSSFLVFFPSGSECRIGSDHDLADLVINRGYLGDAHPPPFIST